MSAQEKHMKKLKWAAGAAGLLVAFLQVRALTFDYTNPPIESTLTVEASGHLPPEVDSILERACKNCHSYETRWPQYSRVALVSQLITYDVDRARRMLNLSRYNRYKPRRARVWIDSACSAVEEGRMPLPRYQWMHEEARLSERDIRSLCDWANNESERLKQLEKEAAATAAAEESP